MAVLTRQTKFDSAFPAEGRQVYKSGRFADAMTGDEKIFPNALEYDGKIIFADSRLSGVKKFQSRQLKRHLRRKLNAALSRMKTLISDEAATKF